MVTPRQSPHDKQPNIDFEGDVLNVTSATSSGQVATQIPIGPGHHLRDAWEGGYPGSVIVVPDIERAQDRDLIG